MGGLRIGTIVLAAALIAAPTAAASRKLSVTGLDAPSSARPGDALRIEGTVGNAGHHRARAFVRAAVAETRLGKTRLARPAGSERPFTINGVLPADIAPAAYQLTVCVRRVNGRGGKRCAVAPLMVEGPGSTPPVFTPGARSAGDPLLPQIGNGGYDARHYALALDYDPAANVFDAATMTMSARATQNLSELSLDFQDLPVDSVTIDGTAATFSQVAATPAISGGGTQPMKLVVTPASGILGGTSFELEVSYHGEPQVFTDPDGSIEGWIPSPVCAPPVSCNSHFVVGEPMGSQAWFPSNDHPSDKATYETKITVPAGEVAVGVGELAGQTTSGGSTTWTWAEDDPTASYLVTASNGNFDLVQGSVTEALTGRTLPIYDAISGLALPTQHNSILALTARDEEMIDALGAHYGPFPLDSYGSLWDNNPSVGYALEVQTKSHFSSLSSGASTYLHELSHQWWGDAISPEHWNDLWFNEGFATLSEWIFNFESGATTTSPADRFDDEYSGASASDWSVAPAVLDNDPAKMFSPSFPTYKRGAMTIEGYREIIGEGPFDVFTRSLQSELAGGSISTPGFIARAKAASGFSGARLQLLDDYFQQWLYGTTKPTIEPEDV